MREWAIRRYARDVSRTDHGDTNAGRVRAGGFPRVGMTLELRVHRSVTSQWFWCESGPDDARVARESAQVFAGGVYRMRHLWTTGHFRPSVARFRRLEKQDSGRENRGSTRQSHFEADRGDQSAIPCG